MKFENFNYHSWDKLRLASENNLTRGPISIAMTSTNNSGHIIYLEIMIFIYKAKKSEFEVRVYKSDKSDSYVPHPDDNFAYSKENDKYISFFFKSFSAARDFTMLIPKNHCEYKKRIIRKSTSHSMIKVTYLGSFYPNKY